MRLGYLGPAGTFGEEAALRYAPDATLVPFNSHAAVAAAVESGEADEGVLAVENFLNGSVAETLDILIHETSLRIQHELVLPVDLHLMAAPGVDPANISVIYSHTQALGQCSTFLSREYPNAHLEAALSTSQAVEFAVIRGDGAAAIGTLRAAEVYGARVLARSIQDSTGNVTRFVVVGPGEQPSTGKDRTSIAFTFPQDRPGALLGVLNELAGRDINCTKVESRPTKEVFGEYVFLVDFEGHQDDPEVHAALEGIRPQCAMLKVFGSYPRWQ
ncbi:MAG: prephenate dehydratase [Dehalococcoidia bacterium]|nr:prephenate dehydratase [Dehalococcoidia bacterium]